MSVGAKDLGKTVVARWGSDGGVKTVGEMIGYYDQPTVLIRKQDGRVTTWAASLCEVEAVAPSEVATDMGTSRDRFSLRRI